MRLAYFSPLPPQQSGISDYSEALLPHLSQHFDIDLWVSGFTPDSALSRKYRIIDYSKSKNQISHLEHYDYILYNIGNNPTFHAEMYDAFLKYPGHVILHDFVLFFLITGYYLDYKNERVSYIQEFYENYGNEGIHAVKKILQGSIPPLQFQNPEKYPLIRKIIQTAPGIIVHSESTKKALVTYGCSPEKIAKINQINYSNMNFNFSPKQCKTIKKQFKIKSDGILIASLGYIAPTKRNAQVIKAVNEIISSSRLPIEYLMIGDGTYIDDFLNPNIKKTGFIPKGDYEKLVSCSDIIVNLRYPSMGETSATLLQAMTAGKPCIVSDIAWFSELPDNTVLKISIDKNKENDELKQSVNLLISDTQKRTDLGKNAQRYILEYHNPFILSNEICQFIINGTFSKPGDLEAHYYKSTSARIHELLSGEHDISLLKDFTEKTMERLKDLGLRYNKKNRESWFSYQMNTLSGGWGWKLKDLRSRIIK